MELKISPKKLTYGKKKDPWQVKFIDKMLLFSKYGKKLLKGKFSIKKFHLASFSIDTGAKLYADKVDALYEFVSSFLKSLFSQKSSFKFFSEKKIKTCPEKVITLKTTREKEARYESKPRKITSLFCKPLFEKKKFDFYVKDSKKFKKLQVEIKKHKEIFNFKGINNFKVTKVTPIFLYRKEINYQTSLQIVNITKIYLNLIMVDFSEINSKKKEIFFNDNFSTKFYPQDVFICEKINQKKILNKRIFLENFFRKKKKKISFPKKKKKKFLFDLKKETKQLNCAKKNIQQKIERKIFKNNHLLISWKKLLLNHFLYIKKNFRKIDNPEKEFLDYLKFDKNDNLLSDKKRRSNYEINKKVNESVFYNLQKTEAFLPYEKVSFSPIKIQDFIVYINTSKLNLFRNSIQKINLLDVFKTKISCVYHIFYPLKLFKKISFLSGIDVKKKDNFFYYFICFLHSAFQKKELLLGEINLKYILIFSHQP